MIFFIPETATASFEIEDAKEWWYGTFKQSQRFTSFDLASDFIKMKKGQSPNYLETLTPETRFPSWKSGNIVHAGSTTFIEFNLVQQYTSIPIPVKWGEDDNDRKRIANATIQKLLIVKKKNGLIVERIVTIIPSLDYLKKNNYFNKIENILTLPGDFSGIVLVRDWNEVSKANWLYKDGKRKTLELRRKNDAELNEITTMYTPCPPYWGVIDVDRWCIDVHEGNSDEPSGYCDNPNNWHERIVEGWVYPEGDCGESGNDPCGDMGFEQCQCVTYGIGCEGGDGEEDPPQLHYPLCPESFNFKSKSDDSFWHTNIRNLLFINGNNRNYFDAYYNLANGISEQQFKNPKYGNGFGNDKSAHDLLEDLNLIRYFERKKEGDNYYWYVSKYGAQKIAALVSNLAKTDVILEQYGLFDDAARSDNIAARTSYINKADILVKSILPGSAILKQLNPTALYSEPKYGICN